MILHDSLGHLDVLIFWTFSISVILDQGEISLYLLDELHFLQSVDCEITGFAMLFSVAGNKPEFSSQVFVNGIGFH